MCAVEKKKNLMSTRKIPVVFKIQAVNFLCLNTVCLSIKPLLFKFRQILRNKHNTGSKCHSESR